MKIPTTTTRIPNLSSSQNGSRVCKACPLLFIRYQRNVLLVDRSSGSKKTIIGVACAGVILLLLLLAVAVLYFFRRRGLRVSIRAYECNASADDWGSTSDIPEVRNGALNISEPVELDTTINDARSETTTVNPRDIWAPTTLEREFQGHQEHRGFSRYPGSSQNGMSAIHEIGSLVTLESPPLGFEHFSNTIPKIDVDPERRTPVNIHPSNSTSSRPKSDVLHHNTRPDIIRCEAENCNKTFVKDSDYKHHKRYHDRPEKCQRCGNGFGTIKDLNRHINDAHLASRRYYCSVAGCKYCKSEGGSNFFTRKDNWRRHMNTRHGKKAEDVDIGTFDDIAVIDTEDGGEGSRGKVHDRFVESL